MINLMLMLMFQKQSVFPFKLAAQKQFLKYIFLSVHALQITWNLMDRYNWKQPFKKLLTIPFCLCGETEHLQKGQFLR